MRHQSTTRPLPKAIFRSDGSWVKLVDAADNLRDRTIIALFLTSGIRLAELCGLELPDLLLDEQKLVVVGKGGKVRYVFIGDYAVKLLRDYLEERPSPKAGMGEPLFVSRHREPISPRMVQYIVRRAAQRAGLPNWISPHKLRHSHATAMLAEDADLETVARQLGHESIQTTRIYLHLEDADRRATAQRVAATIDPAKQRRSPPAKL
jgi:site-specific recombinase XerD